MALLTVVLDDLRLVKKWSEVTVVTSGPRPFIRGRTSADDQDVQIIVPTQADEFVTIDALHELIQTLAPARADPDTDDSSLVPSTSSICLAVVASDSSLAYYRISNQAISLS
jgi:hypothetical protein